ncbi:hypothetical protein C6P40_000452 [Pichia californica]|uniref:Uncharacterized protein n=1 Tax=Pichia californica TaxID=460514 RepID=A0A9P6WPK8_9ASCO|nr:hypothetical protein C6P42_001844 [[Candida] californica]KAG0690954.1 hypothetical protein C6P40_000452 [[Candida] californica]
MNLILNSLIKSSEFIEKLGKILQIELPFKFYNTRDNINIININIKDFKINFKEFNSILELNNIQFNKFCICLSCLILNIVILLNQIDKNFKFKINKMKLKDLMDCDILIMRIIKIIGNDDDENEIIKRQERLNLSKGLLSNEKNSLEKKKSSSFWKKWFEKTHNHQIEEDSSLVTKRIIPRYKLDLHEYSQSIETSILPEYYKGHITTPLNNTNARELIHDERRLSREIYIYLSEAVKVLKEVKLVDNGGKSKSNSGNNKLNASQWVLT